MFQEPSRQKPSRQKPPRLDQQVTSDGRIVKPEFASDHPTAPDPQQVDWQARFDSLFGRTRSTASIQSSGTISAPIEPQRPRSQTSSIMDQGNQFGSINRIIQAPGVRPRHAPPLPGYDKIIRTDPVPINPSDPSPFAKLAPVAFYNRASQTSAADLAWVGGFTRAPNPTPRDSNSDAVPPATPVSVTPVSASGADSNVKKRSHTFGNADDTLPDDKRPCLDLTEPSPRHALPSETTKFSQFTPKLTAPASLTSGGTSKLYSRPWSDRPIDTESGKTFTFTANFTAPSLPVGDGTSTPPSRPWSGRPTESGKTVTPHIPAPSSLLGAVSSPSVSPGNYGAVASTIAQPALPAQQAISVSDQIKKLEAELKQSREELSEKIKDKDNDRSNKAAIPQHSGEVENTQADTGAPTFPDVQAPASQALITLENAPTNIETGEDAYARRARMAAMSSGHTGGNVSATAPIFAVASDETRHLRPTNFLPFLGASAPAHITDDIGADISVELQLGGSIMSDFTDLSACNSVQAFFVKLQDVLEHQLMGRDISHVYARFSNDIHERVISIFKDNRHAFDAMIRVVAAQASGHKLFMVVQVFPKMPLALGAPTSNYLPKSGLA